MSRIPPPSFRTGTGQNKSSQGTRAGASTATPRPRVAIAKPSGLSTPISRSAASTPPPRSPLKSPTKAKSSFVEQSSPSKTPVNIKEAIALKRAEAKKAAAQSSRGRLTSPDDLGPDDKPDYQDEEAEEDLLGRSTVRECIEEARNSGTLVLTARTLPCLPSALFDIHLGITPDPLPKVPVEPPLPPSGASRVRRKNASAPSWFEAQDLVVIKASSNEIVEIQHEISLFGSLQNIDLHINKLTTLPDTFADLMALTILDLSRNLLESLPRNIFALPNLISLNLSNNALTALPFSAPFSDQEEHQVYARSRDRGDLFAPVISRASEPLPSLQTLDLSQNKLTAASIDLALPKALVKLDLSNNPLGGGDFQGADLIRAIARLAKIKELRFEKAELSDDAFPQDLSSSASVFPSLCLLDLGETKATAPGITGALQGMGKEISFDVTNEPPAAGTIRVVVGKKTVKEAWELDLERRERARKEKLAVLQDGDWGIGAVSIADVQDTEHITSKPAPVRKTEVPKEAWELEAESGLLTEGGRRRARAAAAAAALGVSPGTGSVPKSASLLEVPTLLPSPVSRNIGSYLTHSRFYSADIESLTLPPSNAAAPGFHGRSQSAAFSSKGGHGSADIDIALPTSTLPLALIDAQPLAKTLRVLVLANRRKDPCFELPSADAGPFLPQLQELNLEGCRLGDSAAITVGEGPGSARAKQPLLPLLARLFPSLMTLNLSDNGLTSASTAKDALAALILADPAANRRGLKVLQLQGNRLTDLDGFAELAQPFKIGAAPGWKLEELDLRDNQINRLPPELGLMTLDVLLVDGNLFRIPQRRVWEREGTKGLLSWLKGRIE